MASLGGRAGGAGARPPRAAGEPEEKEWAPTQYVRGIVNVGMNLNVALSHALSRDGSGSCGFLNTPRRGFESVPCGDLIQDRFAVNHGAELDAG